MRKVEYVRDPQQGKQQKQRQRFYANALSIYTKASKSSFGNASASSAAVCKKTYSKITHDSTLSQSHNVFASNHQSDSDTPTLLPNTSQHCTVEAVAACHLASCSFPKTSYRHTERCTSSDSCTLYSGNTQHSHVAQPVCDGNLNSNPDCYNSLVFYNNTVTNKILVVDNINNPVEFASSQHILNEIHSFYPDIKVDFAYSLAKGGIAIQQKRQRLPSSQSSCGVIWWWDQAPS